MNDEELISRIKNKEYGKLTKYLYRYFPVIKKFIIRNSGNKQDAEDVFQDALIILFNKMNSDSFKLTSSLDTYLFGISKNLWYDQLRRKSKYAGGVDMKWMIESEASYQETMEEDKKIQLAIEAVSALGSRCKDLLTLFYFKKWSMNDIAKKLEFSSEQIAKNQKYRCIEKAKEIYSSLI